MRFHPAPLLLLAFGLAACEDTGSPAGTGSTTEYGDTTDGRPGNTDPTDTGTRHPFGTQVGSEGFWGCVITTRTAVAAEELVPGTSSRAGKLAEDTAGQWVLDYSLTAGGTARGTLWVDAATDFTVVETDSCGSYVEARVTAILERDGADIAVDGLLALSADETAFRLAALSTDADVEEVWGTPPSASLGFLRVDGKLSGDAVSGSVSHADCLLATCTEQKELALYAGSR